MSAHRRVLSARVKTSAAVVATGIGAVAAAGVLATPAAAAGGDAWAAIRQCESGGNYSINTGSGFYGAYQFTLQSWRSLGLSGLPSDASPAVQDQAAHRLAAQYGMKPWPVCGKRYGGPAPSGGGSASVQTPVSRRTTSSVPVPTQPSTASSYHRDTSHKSHWQSHNFPRHPSYRSHHSDRSLWGYRSAPQSTGVVRVLSVRLVGQTRADVWLYQLGLDRIGYHLVADGRFGPLTRLSTMHFQAAHGLAVDGLAGPHTKAALLRALAG